VSDISTLVTYKIYEDTYRENLCIRNQMKKISFDLCSYPHDLDNL